MQAQALDSLEIMAESCIDTPLIIYSSTKVLS